MAWDVIEQKLESLRRALRRVEEKCPEHAIVFAKNIDTQDILTLNVTRAAASSPYVLVCRDQLRNLLPLRPVSIIEAM